MTVSINPPMTPVTAGSGGIAAATTPNVCKMPGPPAPFVPTPLPNIGKSGESPKNFSKSVVIGGKKVAIKGATFKSIGDAASKGTGGGVVSAATHGVTKFVGPGSMNVKFEGKNVQLLSDPMLNNCGPSGAPGNAATVLGIMQKSGLMTAVEAQTCVVCGKEHEALEETEATKTDLGVLRIQFEAQIRALEAERAITKAALRQQWLTKRNKEPPADMMKSKVSVRTMLGVVECMCKKQYGDQSGMTTVELCAAAAQSGMRHASGVTASYGDGKKAKATARAEQVAAVAEGLKDFTGSTATVNERWDCAVQEAQVSSELRDGPAAYPPGVCAAQRAMLLLIDDQALPAAMTEEWYHDQGESTDSPLEYIDASRGGRELLVQEINDRDTAPPCKTCSVILPMLLCTKDKKTCDHRT
ncbi:DUF4150 domain-containing protein [Enhygromyxa salina]|uniref:Uncharacterized protein n=1 Tax=Enhygromyxa salina TaxID=215803 RepID=A0A2S9YAD3_9BACT|nr:DUF4150 domain-containing protein [Enhygromyxa salina]PRQ02063.1 hypothetical protein ENSA7_56360 [Enhygromyxa salina]